MGTCLRVEGCVSGYFRLRSEAQAGDREKVGRSGRAHVDDATKVLRASESRADCRGSLPDPPRRFDPLPASWEESDQLTLRRLCKARDIRITRDKYYIPDSELRDRLRALGDA